jgi:dsRNA-specific ribonuclease
MEINNQQTLDKISITKIVFSEPNPKVEKTPIMILQEICTKLNVHSIYENISTEGQVHDPSFGYRVTCGNISKTGKGNSKKKAKQAAALTMLNYMKEEMIGRNDAFVKSVEDYL